MKNFLWGILILPLACSTLYHLPEAVLPLASNLNSVLLIILGAVLYALFETLFSRPMRTYVFGHELTHALASLALGGEVFSFNVSKKGGSVLLSKTNFFVALAPYCFPIYTIFVFLIYALVKLAGPFAHQETVFLIVVGATLAFHASLTLYAIRQEQPDLKETGFFFSIVFILLVNGWVLLLLSKILFWDMISVKGFIGAAFNTQWRIWVWTFQNIRTALRWVNEKIAPRFQTSG